MVLVEYAYCDKCKSLISDKSKVEIDFNMEDLRRYLGLLNIPIGVKLLINDDRLGILKETAVIMGRLNKDDDEVEIDKNMLINETIRALGHSCVELIGRNGKLIAKAWKPNRKYDFGSMDICCPICGNTLVKISKRVVL